MSKRNATFIDLYLKGKVRADDISDAISAWHRGSGDGPLHDYLGMTEAEYDSWLHDPDVLPYIAVARKEDRDLAEIIESAANEIPKAARSSNTTRVQKLRQGQKRLGKIH